jgi:hypothetical protein
MKKIIIILCLILLGVHHSCNYNSPVSIELHSDECIDSIFQAVRNKNKAALIIIEDSIQHLESSLKLISIPEGKYKTAKEMSNYEIKERIELKNKLNLLIESLKKMRIPFEYANFPVADIKQCIKDTIPRKEFINHLSCPICSIKSELLLWIQFKSPESTWKQMCGKEGPLSICENCKIPIEFITYRMN